MWLFTTGYNGHPDWFTTDPSDHHTLTSHGLPIEALDTNPHDPTQVPPSVRRMLDAFTDTRLLNRFDAQAA